MGVPSAAASPARSRSGSTPPCAPARPRSARYLRGRSVEHIQGQEDLMRSISCIAAVLFAAPLVTAAAQQPFEGVVEYDMTGSGQTIHTIYYQKGSHVRTEMNAGGQTAAMIMDGAAGTMTTLVPAQKMYMTM